MNTNNFGKEANVIDMLTGAAKYVGRAGRNVGGGIAGVAGNVAGGAVNAGGGIRDSLNTAFRYDDITKGQIKDRAVVGGTLGSLVGGIRGFLKGKNEKQVLEPVAKETARIISKITGRKINVPISVVKTILGKGDVLDSIAAYGSGAGRIPSIAKKTLGGAVKGGVIGSLGGAAATAIPATLGYIDAPVSAGSAKVVKDLLGAGASGAMLLGYEGIKNNKKRIADEVRKDVALRVGTGAGIAGTLVLGSKIIDGAKTIRVKSKIKKDFPELNEIPKKMFNNIFESLVGSDKGLLDTPWVLAQQIMKHYEYGSMDISTVKTLLDNKAKRKSSLEGALDITKKLTSSVF